MMRLLVESLWQILRFEYYVQHDDFALLYKQVRNARCAPATTASTVDEICRAIDLVCALYPKLVLCLQRSAATACLLKRYGIPAEMVIGVQPIPFKAHAWVEVDRSIVNDKTYTPEMYQVLDRC